jgi:hypothetical protein
MRSITRSVTRILARAVACSLLVAGLATVAAAQIPPGLPNPALQNRIPAPLPPPAQPPIINGPLSQSPPPGVKAPPRINSFSDRATACAHEGSGFGLRGRKLDAYTRSCANQ